VSQITPIFIGGCDRSGTTLLGAMVGGHSRCLTTPAAQFVTDSLPALGRDGDQLEQQRWLHRFVGSHYQFSTWRITPPECVPLEDGRSAVAAWYSELVRRYGAMHGRTGFDRWVSHSPENIRHVASLRRLFPQSRFIHIVRDGRGVAASAKRLPWGYRTMKQLALLWVERVAFGLAAEAQWPQAVYRVRYEDLVCRPAETLRGIASFLDLPYEAAMTRGGGYRVGRPGGHELVGKPPDPSRASAWRSSLSMREIELFEFYSGEMLEYLGYEMLSASVPPTRRERVAQEVVGVLARVRRLLRTRSRSEAPT
jgi:hypothetical protein